MSTDLPEQTDAAAPVADAAPAKTEAELALETRLAEMSDAYLRAKAEAENARLTSVPDAWYESTSSPFVIVVITVVS